MFNVHGAINDNSYVQIPYNKWAFYRANTRKRMTRATTTTKLVHRQHPNDCYVVKNFIFVDEFYPLDLCMVLMPPTRATLFFHAVPKINGNTKTSSVANKFKICSSRKEKGFAICLES